MNKKTNTTPKRQFIDTEQRGAMDAYHELLEDEYDTDDLRRFIKKYPDFYDPYLQVAEDMREMGHENEARLLEDEAYTRAVSRVVKTAGGWPDLMWWSVVENRHVIRAIATGADNHWKDGNTEGALDVYRKLLHSNLNDNIAARYAIIALRRGITYDEYMAELWPNPTMPAEHVFAWFSKYRALFPEELAEWRQYCFDELGLEEKDLA